MRVFISSTSKDLEPHRLAAADVIRDAQSEPIGMEHFPADPRPIIQVCRDAVGQCDLVILLQAFRQGWVPELKKGGDGQTSITGLEIAAADEFGTPVLAFLADENWPGQLWDEDPVARAWAKKFRTNLNRNAKFFQWERDSKLTSFRALLSQELANYRMRGPALTVAMSAAERVSTLRKATGPAFLPELRYSLLGPNEHPATFARRDLEPASPRALFAKYDQTSAGSEIDWLDERETVRQALEQARESYPEMALAMELCAVPRRFGATLLGVLRDRADDLVGNERIIDALAECTFVVPNRAGGYEYAKEGRKLLLDHWGADAAKQQTLEALNRKLAEFYWGKFEEDQGLKDEDTAVLVVPTSFVATSTSAGELSVAPLLEALYHVTRISADTAYDFFEKRFDVCLDEDRFGTCEALLAATRESLGRFETEDCQVAFWKLELREARLQRRTQRSRKCKEQLDKLRARQDLPAGLERDVLTELGDLLAERQQFASSLELYNQRLALARKPEAGAFHLALAHISLGILFCAVSEYPRAVDELTEAVRVAGTLELGIWARTALSGALLDHGRWDDAWNVALEALHLARTEHRVGAAAHQEVAQRLMSLVGSRSPALVDTLFAEAMTLRSPKTTRVTLDLRKQFVEILQEGGQLGRASENLHALFSEAGRHPDRRFRTQLFLLKSSLRTDERLIEEGIDIYGEVLRHELEDEVRRRSREGVDQPRGLERRAGTFQPGKP
jgi:tetratricopeptide (TPR) repeat protein